MNRLCGSVIFPAMRQAARLCDGFDGSVGEVLILTAIWAGIIWLACTVRRLIAGPRRRAVLADFVLTAACLMLTVYGGFCLLWGTAYSTDSFQDRSGIVAQPVSVEELEQVTRYFASELTAAADGVPRDASGVCAADRKTILAAAGSTLEQQWGTAKFNLYYFSGMLLTVIGAILASLITGNSFISVAGTTYVNLSMFFAFAMLFPDTTVLFMFFLPVKMKWLAYLDGALFAFDIIRAIGQHNWAGVVLPVVALLNFAVFIWPEVHYLANRTRQQYSPRTVQFKQAVKQQEKEKGYHHKCAVCGRTDTDYPDLQFRYCSKCAGYHCFCQDHIFNHVHFTEE